MLLRGSGEFTGNAYDLDSVVGGAGEGETIPAADLLAAYGEAFYEGGDALRATRQRIRDELGAGALVDAAAIVAIFNAVVRVADATGIPLEEEKAEISADLRETLGIDDFPSAQGG